MSNIESKKLSVNFLSKGTFTAQIDRINAPTTIQKIMAELPLKGRGLKQGSRIVMPTSLVIRPEKPRKNFYKGNISVDPSSGNISFHLENGETSSAENYLGNLSDFELNDLTVSVGIIIKEIGE